MVKCPDCGEEVQIEEDVKVGNVVGCQNCGVELEILSLDPLEVAILEEEK